MQRYPDTALAIFDEGFNCAQAVFAAFAPGYNMNREQALKVASAFGGGMNMGATCGALTGAMLALGMAAGFSVYSPEIKDSFKELNLDLTERFRKRVGHLDCRDILEIDPTIDEQKQAARDAGILASRCPNCVRIAAEICYEILHELDIE